MASLTLKNIKKSFGATKVIHGVDLDVQDGEFVVFVGPSGCGKSTLLRMIAGLENITGGEMLIGDMPVNDVAPAKRGVAMVFQTYALYPHMSVRKNMSFGLIQAKMPSDEIKKRVDEAAEILQLNDYMDRQPKHLSGGQRQRVAIGRAIVRDPEIFLFDEPLSNLDAALRVQTRVEIAKLHARLKSTMIYVTHDQVEALTLADKIVVLNAGSIEQVGTPMTLYENPDNLFVAGFIGSPKMNFVSGRAQTNQLTGPTGNSVSMNVGRADGDVTIGLRPEHLKSCDKQEALLSGKLDLIEKLGEYVLAYLYCDEGKALTVKMPKAPDAQPGDMLYFDCPTEHIHIFDTQSGTRLN